MKLLDQLIGFLQAVRQLLDFLLACQRRGSPEVDLSFDLAHGSLRDLEGAGASQPLSVLHSNTGGDDDEQPAECEDSGSWIKALDEED